MVGEIRASPGQAHLEQSSPGADLPRGQGADNNVTHNTAPLKFLLTPDAVWQRTLRTHVALPDKIFF